MLFLLGMFSNRWFIDISFKTLLQNIPFKKFQVSQGDFKLIGSVQRVVNSDVICLFVCLCMCVLEGGREVRVCSVTM
jgi:hypothetical protein